MSAWKYLSLFAVIISGTDLTNSDVDFVQQITSTPVTQILSSSTASSLSSTQMELSLTPPVLLSDSLTATGISSAQTPVPLMETTSAMPTSTTPTTTTTTTTTSPEILQFERDQLYLEEYEKNPPKFRMTVHDINVTVQIGSHAYLPCQIRRLLNKPISWVRVRDGHILTVDQTTFIADQRFQSIFKGENVYTWSLQIKYVAESDMGWYECQVSTEPKMSAKVYLKVIVPITELIGDASRFVKAGSKVALHCIVRGTLEPPQFIIWFRGTQQIMDDNKQGWFLQIDRNIFGNHSDQSNTIGSLIIPFVKKQDSGNYTCTPSNSAPVTVDLHVLSGEYSASAIMSSAAINELSCSLLVTLLLLICHTT